MAFIANETVDKVSTQSIELLDGSCVTFEDDALSDRIRCDHPDASSSEELANRLLVEASVSGRGRVVLMASEEMGKGLLEEGFECEAQIPGFYKGEEDCWIMGAWPDEGRQELANPKQVARVMDILDAANPPTHRERVVTSAASVEDAAAIAELIGSVFDVYPTPSDDPAYIAEDIYSGTPYRVVRDGGKIVACASADLVEGALSAELTDCATRPSHRGQGLMSAILADLIIDLKALDFETAFTMARANQVGMNLVFQRLGFDLHGTMSQSCYIGSGLEDMNVWSQGL